MSNGSRQNAPYTLPHQPLAFYFSDYMLHIFFFLLFEQSQRHNSTQVRTLRRTAPIVSFQVFVHTHSYMYISVFMTDCSIFFFFFVLSLRLLLLYKKLKKPKSNTMYKLLCYKSNCLVFASLTVHLADTNCITIKRRKIDDSLLQLLHIQTL